MIIRYPKQIYAKVIKDIAPLLELDASDRDEIDFAKVRRIQESDGFEARLAILISLWGEKAVAASILRLIQNGMSKKEFAKKTGIADASVLMRKLNLKKAFDTHNYRPRDTPSPYSTGHGPLFELRQRLPNPETKTNVITQKQMAEIGKCAKETIVKSERKGVWPSQPIKERMIKYALAQGVNVQDLVDKNELEEMRQWEFTVDGGKYFVDGKAYWPDYVTVRVPRERALLLVEEMSRQLQQTTGDDMLTLYQFGHLFRSEDD